MHRNGAACAAFGAALLASGAAQAAEAHLGLMAHNICVTDCKNAELEPGPNVDVQVSFDAPAWLRPLGAPQPYLLASLNTQGATHYAAAGLEWRIGLGGRWALEPGLGYAVHSGELENPHPPGSPESAAYARRNIQFGSRDLFRVSLALTRDLAGPWEAQLMYSHLSHGQVIGSGRNQGLDQIGLRVGYRFGG